MCSSGTHNKIILYFHNFSDCEMRLDVHMQPLVKMAVYPINCVVSLNLKPCKQSESQQKNCASSVFPVFCDFSTRMSCQLEQLWILSKFLAIQQQETIKKDQKEGREITCLIAEFITQLHSTNSMHHLRFTASRVSLAFLPWTHYFGPEKYIYQQNIKDALNLMTTLSKCQSW